MARDAAAKIKVEVKVKEREMREADKIQTQKVQYWRNGIMLTAQMTREQAQKLVDAGEAFVITGQAVGAIIDGKKSA